MPEAQLPEGGRREPLCVKQPSFVKPHMVAIPLAYFWPVFHGERIPRGQVHLAVVVPRHLQKPETTKALYSYGVNA